jgi:hypothetical protein
MGERSAVRPKSGQSVCQSDPGLRRPTPPSTAGLKPAARPSFQFPAVTNSKDHSEARAAGLTQRKTGRSARQSLAVQFQRAALGSIVLSPALTAAPSYPLDDSEIAMLIQFFETLDRWDREARSSNSVGLGEG